jgi:hypothetical protein
MMMGTDIHGVWEVRVPDGRWFAFRSISDGRSYTWFGIMSGVRGAGPKCASECWYPPDADAGAEVVSEYWRTICTRWGGMHDHTVAGVDTVREANDAYCVETQEQWGDHSEAAWLEYESIPQPDDIIDALWLGIDRWGEMNSLPLGIPLRDVMGLPSDVHGHDERFKARLRYLCAYDS